MARHGVGAWVLAWLVLLAHGRLAERGPATPPCPAGWVGLQEEASLQLTCGIGAAAATLVRCPPSRDVHPGDVVRAEAGTTGCQTRVRPLPAPLRLALGQPLPANEASRSDLEALPGIGPALAARVVAARPYAHPADLLRVKGIGPARLQTLAPLLRWGPPPLLWPSWPPPAASTHQKP